MSCAPVVMEPPPCKGRPRAYEGAWRYLGLSFSCMSVAVCLQESPSTRKYIRPYWSMWSSRLPYGTCFQALSRSKVDRFVPPEQHIDLRIVGSRFRAAIACFVAAGERVSNVLPRASEYQICCRGRESVRFVAAAERVSPLPFAGEGQT